MLRTALGAVMMLVVVAGQVHGQSGAVTIMAKPDCGYKAQCGGHWASHANLLAPGPDQRKGLHSDCRICRNAAHPNYPNEGSELEWFYCHDKCEELNGYSLQAYQDALQAAASNDISRLVALSIQIPERVRINGPRRSVQITSCDGSTLIANIPLTQGQFAEYRQAMVDVAASR